jgi:hypothetical protein
MAEFAVLGHACDGLETFQKKGGGCVPLITEEGHITGCDAANDTPLHACPFCGTKWKHPTECYYCGTAKYGGQGA